MALKKETPCKGIEVALRDLKRFIEKERVQAEKSSKTEYWDRDMKFINKMEAEIASCDEEKLKLLLEEFRGLSHYFGSYVSNLSNLDKLLDTMYQEIQKSLLSFKNR